MNAVDEVAAVHRLNCAGLSQRQIADQLGITRHRVRQALTGPVAAQPPTVGEPAARPAAHSPNRPPTVGDQPHTVAVDGARLVVDLDQHLGLAADLAVLARTGRSPAEVFAQAVGAVADAYRTALREGRINPGVPFFLPPIELHHARWMDRTA